MNSSPESEVVRLSEPAAVAMHDDWYELARADHFWMRWRFASLAKLRRHLPPPPTSVFEIGCGSGVFRTQLEELGYDVDACDLNLPALEQACPGRGRLMVYDIHSRHPDLRARYEAVFLLDTIEHIADDRAFLESAAWHLRPGGVVVINVPAIPALFSKYDEVVGHERRYSRQSLSDVLERSGLEPLAVHYWGLSMVPILAVRKVWLAFLRSEGGVVRRGFAPPSASWNALLNGIGAVERRLFRNVPYGTSLLGIARLPR